MSKAKPTALRYHIGDLFEKASVLLLQMNDLGAEFPDVWKVLDLFGIFGTELGSQLGHESQFLDTDTWCSD